MRPARWVLSLLAVGPVRAQFQKCLDQLLGSRVGEQNQIGTDATLVQANQHGR